MKRTVAVLLTFCTLLCLACGCGLAADPGPGSAEEDTLPEPDSPTFEYDARMQTLYVNGAEDYASLPFPDEISEARAVKVSDDEFEFSAYLVMMRELGYDEKTELPGLIDRTEKSLRFLRQYLRENAGAAYPSELAELPVVFSIDRGFGYQTDGERIELKDSDVGTHREFLYLLALMNSDAVGWEQLGYAWYVGTCIDPYSEAIERWPIVPKLLYYPQCIAGGVDPEHVTAADFRTVYDACARVCFEKGLTHWGSYCESTPVTSESVFTRVKDKEQGDTLLTAFTAASFLAWLDDAYGFEQLSLFCFGYKSFEEAFGMKFTPAYKEWSIWIKQNYPAE